MSVVEQLDRLRLSVPGCTAVVLADLSAGLVLCSSLARQMPQEELDRLCAQAEACLNGPAAAALPKATAAANRGGPDHAALLGGGSTWLFARSPLDEDDVLCCLCPPNVDINGLAGMARSLLAGLSGQR